jgi:hypothetical protein
LLLIIKVFFETMKKSWVFFFFKNELF